MWRCSLLAVAVLTACPPSTLPRDGGAGGGAMAGGGGNAGGAAGGFVRDDLCDFAGPRGCDAGETCTLTVFADAGVGTRCLAGACDLVDQNCDAGQKCAFLDGGRQCVPDGTLMEGATCANQPASCAKGLACTLVGYDGGSACARFCRLDLDCGAPQRCYVTLVLPETMERPLVCADPPLVCDPLTQNCPHPSEACYPGMGGPGCYPAGVRTVDIGCTYSNDCARGLACTGGGGTTACKALCSFDGGTLPCDAGVCTRLNSSQTVGVCL